MLVNDFLLNETFKIPNLNTFHQLFRHAEARLLSLPPGSKVFRIDHWKREEEAFKEDTEELINTPSSFLRIQGAPDVVMLASGTHRILGEGSSAQVKLAIDKTGCLYAVKIFKPPKSLLQRKQVEAFQEEHRKLQEFKIACGDSFFSQLPFRVKLYSVQHYLGNQLEEFLISAPNLSFKMRIKLAVAVCKCVHQLHAGILSDQNIPYVHFDLKPANFTVKFHEDGSFSVHLIDFGSANPLQELLTEGSPTQIGSLIYFPVDADQMKNKSQIQEIGSQFMQTCGMRACDLIALKRTLNFHAELLHYHPRGCSLFREQDMALLPSSLNHLLSSLHVMTTAPDETALFLAAALANEILPSEEKYPLKELKTNPQLQMELVERTCPNHFTAEESDIENDHNFIIKKGI